jgi:small subunit ribosomal protein S6
MREYELTVIYDLAVAESGGADASVQLLTSAIEARGGRMLRVDHWGRRRMAYPINRAIDGDYIVTRVELDPDQVRTLENGFRIDERIYRHIVVRADELPVPPPPREPRRQPQAEQPAPAAADGSQAATAPVAEAPQAPVADATGIAESPATPAEAAAMGEAEESPAPVPSENAPEPGSAPASDTIEDTEANA